MQCPHCKSELDFVDVLENGQYSQVWECANCGELDEPMIDDIDEESFYKLSVNMQNIKAGL
jgi:uncharacterized Zn finger protein